MNFLILFQQTVDEQIADGMVGLSWFEKLMVQIVPFVFWLVLAAAAIAIILSLLNMLKSPKTLINFLIGIAILLGIFFIGYLFSNGDVPTGYDVSEQTSRLIGAGIWTVGVFMLIGFIFLIGDLIRGIFKF